LGEAAWVHSGIVFFFMVATEYVGTQPPPRNLDRIAGGPSFVFVRLVSSSRWQADVPALFERIRVLRSLCNQHQFHVVHGLIQSPCQRQRLAPKLAPAIEKRVSPQSGYGGMGVGSTWTTTVGKGETASARFESTPGSFNESAMVLSGGFALKHRAYPLQRHSIRRSP